MTYSVDIYDKGGKVVSTVDLNEAVFADHLVNPTLIHEYYLLQAANKRNAIANTKDRSEVAGSGRKLYRQKGTGNARVGDARSPIRRHGWVVFGPTSDRNFSKNMNKKSRKLALSGLLTIKAQEKSIFGLKDFSYEAPKTKQAVDLLKKIWLNDEKVLVVVSDRDEVITKSFRNIDKVKYLLVDYLNPFDLMHYDKVLIMEDALNKVNQK